MNYLALWLIATLLLPFTPLAAQEDCLGFEDFPTGPLFGQGVGDSPGDTVLQRDNYDVLIQPILYLNGNTGFMTASVQEEANLSWLPGKFLLQGNNVLDFRFSQSVSKVCFDFFDGGGEENFAVNGSEVFVLDKLSELSDLDLPGIEIETQLDSSSSDLLSGTICLSGDIASFRIGGQEFGLDNICTQTLPEGCIGFEGLEEASYGEGDTPPGQVFYEEAEVPMRLAPVQTLFWTNTYNQLKVLDAPQQPDFSNALGQYLNFDGISTVFDLSQYPEPVEKVQVDFLYKNEVDGTVNFAANGSEVLLLFNLMPGFYDLAPGVQLEVVFEENSLNEGQLIFTGDNLQALLIGGLSGLSIDNFCINPQPPCLIEHFTVQASDCNPNNVFDVTIDFDYAGSPDDTIKLYTNGNYQAYAAGDFPLTLQPFIAPTDSILFEAEQWNTPGCKVAAVLPPQDCGEDCPLQEAEVVGTPACSNTNGTVYQAALELPGANLPGDTVVVASQLTGEVAYGVLDSNEGDTFDFSLPNTNELYDLVTVCLLGQPDCCVEVDYDILCPPLCEIEAQFLGGPECLAAGGYLVAFSVPGAEAGDELLVSSQETGQSTTVIYDGQWAEVDFPLPPDGFDKLEICLAEAGELCCAYLEFDLPCTDQCDIQELAIEPEACNEEGEFALYVDLLYEGIPTSFNLSIPELGFEEVYAAGDFPLEIPGLPGDGATYELRIAATDCNAVVEELVDFPNCSPGCTFEQVIVEPHPCEEGEFLVDIEVQVNEPGALGYYIFADGDIFGPYDYSETFITLGPFAGDGETVYDFLILDIEDPACFGYAELGPKDCDDSNCGILSMMAEPQECNGDGTYDLFLDIEMEDPNEDPLFWFYLNGELIAQSTLAMLPGELINLSVTDTENVVFKACIFDQPNCCIEVEYPQPDCLNDNCPIDNVTVDFAFCDTSGFYLELDFDGPVPNTAGSYRIFGNGETYDTLGYDAPRPVIVGPFDPYTDNIYELIVADLQQPNCSDFVEFQSFDCEEGEEVCTDFSVFAGFMETSDDSDGYIGTVTGVDFWYSIPFNDAVKEVSVPDNPFDGFTLADSSVLYAKNATVGFDAGPLPSVVDSRRFIVDYYFENPVDSFIITVDNASYYLYQPLADGTVELTDDISVTFEVINSSLGTMTVEGPVRRLYFGLAPGESLALDNLCITHVLTDECEILPVNVEAEALGCDEDGKYKLFLDFEVENPGNDFFDLYDGEGNFIDFFSLDELPLEIPGFDVGDSSLDSLKICINDNPACCVNVGYEVPDCEGELGTECVTFEIYEGQASENSSDFLAEEYGVVMDIDNGIYSFESGTLPAFSSADSTFLHLTTGTFGLRFEDTLERGVSLDYYLHEDVDSLLLWTASSMDRIMLPILQDTSLMTPSGLSLDFIVDSPQTGHLQVSGISASGNWNQFQVGGFGASREIAIDNVCIDKVTDSNCEVANLTAAATGCGGDGLYDLMIDFEVSNPGLDSFNLYDANENLVGMFSVSSLPLLLEDYAAADVSEDMISVCISNVSDCCQSIAYSVIDCAGSNDVCLSFDIFEGEGASGWPVVDPLFGTENGVQIKRYNGDFCDCYINMPPTAEVSGFETASGAVAEVKDAVIWFELPEEAKAAQLDFEFYEGSDCVILFDDEDIQDGISLSSLTPGAATTSSTGVSVTLNYLTDEADERTATIEIDGVFSEVKFSGSGYIDNFCWTPADQEVWPGDANADNLAHHIDLLNIGLAYGTEGPDRLLDGTGWMPAVASDWDSTFADGTNYKHADCNGDGIIDTEDRNAILENYGLEHAEPEPLTELPGTEIDPPAFIDAPFGLPNGASFELPVVVGTEELPVEDAYGIAFTVEYDPEVLDPNSIELAYPVSWFGEPGVNAITVHKVYSEGQIEVALTRTDNNNVSGHGPVVYIIGIIDDIAGLTKSRVEIKEVYAINQSEGRLPVQGLDTEFEIRASSTNQEELDGAFSLFPNPASDWVNIRSAHGFQVDALRLFSIDGRAVPIRTQDANQRLSLEGLPPGAYLLQIVSGKGAVQKRIIKQ